MISETVSIGIVLKIVFTGRLLIGIAWTVDVWCFQLIGIVQPKWSRRLSTNWNCPENYFHRVSINWNCLVKLFRRLSINWNNSDFRDRPLTGIDWTIDVWCFQLIGTVQTNDLGPRPSIGIVLAIVFTGCLLNGIAWTIDVWCFQLIGIVQTNDLGDCLFIGIVLKMVFTGCVLVGIAGTIDCGWRTWIEIVGTTDFGDRPLIGIIQTIEF